MAAGLLKLIFAQREFAVALEQMGAPLPRLAATGIPLRKRGRSGVVP